MPCDRENVVNSGSSRSSQVSAWAPMPHQIEYGTSQYLSDTFGYGFSDKEVVENQKKLSLLCRMQSGAAAIAVSLMPHPLLLCTNHKFSNQRSRFQLHHTARRCGSLHANNLFYSSAVLSGKSLDAIYFSSASNYCPRSRSSDSWNARSLD